MCEVQISGSDLDSLVTSLLLVVLFEHGSYLHRTYIKFLFTFVKVLKNREDSLKYKIFKKTRGLRGARSFFFKKKRLRLFLKNID